MLSKEENELVCRVGPGTPMGDLMRQYWLPVLLSKELAGPVGNPLRVKLLGEELIAFRATSGNVGLIQNACPHRGASLFFGRNEENGLRCVYHGWKYDVAGRCVDMPNEPPESNFKDKIRATAYPCVERSGMVWAYMGPRLTPPPLPDLEATMLADEEMSVDGYLRDCNWLQALEGDIDTVHASFLHYGAVPPAAVQPDSFTYFMLRQRFGHFVAVETPYGAMYGARRPAGEGREYWRIGQFLFPCWAMAAPGLLGRKASAYARVPMDDEHTMNFQFRMKSVYDAEASSRTAQGEPLGRKLRHGFLPNTSDWYGRSRLEANAENDYLIDREVQKQKLTYTGMAVNRVEDQAVTESMGTIYDRTQEHLGTTDVMIIKTRQRLLAAAKALRDNGTVPPGVDDPEVYRVRSGGTILPEDADWIEETEELRKAFVDHPELDTTVVGPFA